MVFGTVPGAVDQDGTLTVAFVPEAGLANPASPTATELNAVTVIDLTYSLTTTGYNRTISQATDTDERLTLADVLETPGRVTESLEMQYVHGAADDIADPVIQEGVKGFIVERRAVAIGAFVAAEDVDVIPVTFGVPRKDNPTANGKWTKTVKAFVSGQVQRDVPVAAGV